MQEEEDDGHRQQRTLDQGAHQTVERTLDPVARGVDLAQFHVGRQAAADLLGRLLHRLARGHDVGVLLLEDVEVHRTLAVDAGQRIGLALALHQRAQITQRERKPITTRHHQLLELARVAHAALHADERILAGVGQQADGLIGIGFAQGLRNLGGGDAIGTQALRVQVDADLARAQAADVHPGHALHPLQSLAH